MVLNSIALNAHSGTGAAADVLRISRDNIETLPGHQRTQRFPGHFREAAGVLDV